MCCEKVKAVESGRTVSLPGYYKDDEKMLPQWAQEFIPGKVEETDVVLTESASSLAVRITNEEVTLRKACEFSSLSFGAGILTCHVHPCSGPCCLSISYCPPSLCVCVCVCQMSWEPFYCRLVGQSLIF